jgi:hypothetical protein
MSQYSRVSHLLAIAFLSSAVSHNALACGTGNVLFGDTFQKPSGSWLFVSPKADFYTTGPNGITMTLQPNVAFPQINQTGFYQDAEVCFDVTIDKAESDQTYFGVLVWALDNQTNYSLDFFPKTKHLIGYRVQNGHLLTPLPSTNVDVKIGEINKVDIVTKGNHATISLNGTQVAELDGLPPAGGGAVGLDMGTGKTETGPVKVTFSNFEIRALP